MASCMNDPNFTNPLKLLEEMTLLSLSKDSLLDQPELWFCVFSPLVYLTHFTDPCEQTEIAFWYFPSPVIHCVSPKDLIRKQGKEWTEEGPRKCHLGKLWRPFHQVAHVLNKIGRFALRKGALLVSLDPLSLSAPTTTAHPQTLHLCPSFLLLRRGGHESAFRLESVSWLWVLRM